MMTGYDEPIQSDEYAPDFETYYSDEYGALTALAGPDNADMVEEQDAPENGEFKVDKQYRLVIARNYMEARRNAEGDR